jgi:cell division protease FtsH
VPFFSINGSEFVEMFVGVGAARVRDLFAQAKQKAPCIIFIDELDALAKARGLGGAMGGHDEREQTLNQLLVEMDGFDPRAGVIIMAATNRPELLDPALLRAGRFDRHVLVDRPDMNGRRAILEVHAKDIRLAPDIDLDVVARRTPGFVGADLANLLNEAALLAARRGGESVTMEDIDLATDRIVAGLEKKNRLINEDEKRIVAYHESGHALVAQCVEHADRVHKISIVPRGIGALGYTQQLPTEDRYLLTRAELLDRIAVLLGGRVAEEIVFNEISTGAQNDLSRVAELARSMVLEYGMSESLGPLTYETRTRTMLGMRQLADVEQSQHSEETLQEMDREVRRIVDEAHERVRELLTRERKALDEVAERLLEKEVIEGDELVEILEEHTPKRGRKKGRGVLRLKR